MVKKYEEKEGKDEQNSGQLGSVGKGAECVLGEIRKGASGLSSVPFLGLVSQILIF